MEDNSWLLFIGMLLSFALFIRVCITVTNTDSGTTVKKEKKKVDSKFERVNQVEGILYADDLKIKTFNIGELAVDNVTVKLYNHVGKPIQPTDIIFNGQSIYAFAPVGTSYREKAEYAIQVLKNNANQGALSFRTVDEVEHILIEVDNLNDYINDGKVSQISNDTEDFVWVG
ncbi:TPA: hypothetical protein QCR36_004086 [Bacillus cereus]|nr:hypothetical protein [Bacillus cereus]HDR4742552.1 hypothetical protein [Bacillus cereus]HDR4748139.1 hypothetical protein [Bacillus cereus]HDR4753613.1 hypothetical protein [Bacillus cereus]HDR4770822.1 hypothetical protein [Bacillus cereus]